MFGQQKLTPTQTADATQQKVMMFMPVVFGFIMKDLPSGLVFTFLYPPFLEFFNSYMFISRLIKKIMDTIIACCSGSDRNVAISLIRVSGFLKDISAFNEFLV